MTARHRQIERSAASWLARRDAGGWADRQQSALDAWLAEDTAHRVAFLRLEAAWNEAARLKTLAAGAGHGQVPARGAWADSPYFASPLGSPRAVAGHTRTARASRGRRRHRPLLAGAAAALLVVAALAGGLLWRNSNHVERAAWSTLLGAQQVVHLADGSTATLGSDTELRMAFSRHERALELTRGEAYFDVAHDTSRPFVVNAGGYHVIAVGTRFDVRRDTDGLRVVVTRGLVRLQSARDPAPAATMLPSGSIALVDGGNVVVRHIPLDRAMEYLSWRDGYVVFHGTPLAQAIDEFNRYNARKIVLADPSLDGLRVGGNFRLDNSTAFVRLMQQVFPVRVEQRTDGIVLSRRGNPNTAH